VEYRTAVLAAVEEVVRLGDPIDHDDPWTAAPSPAKRTREITRASKSVGRAQRSWSGLRHVQDVELDARGFRRDRR